MNRKGFTLIELLAVIVLIGILGVLIVPGLLDNVETSKQASYNTLIENIVTSSQIYYEECEYGDLSNEKYEIYSCKIINDSETDTERKSYIKTTLGTLANTGLLKVNDKKTENGKEIKIVLNPIDNQDMSNCQIKITKVVNKTNFLVTYQVENISTESICPTTYK